MHRGKVVLESKLTAICTTTDPTAIQTTLPPSIQSVHWRHHRSSSSLLFQLLPVPCQISGYSELVLGAQMPLNNAQMQNQIKPTLSAPVAELHQVGVTMQGLVLNNAFDLLVERFQVQLPGIVG